MNLAEYIEGVRLKWDESKGYSAEFAREHDRVLAEVVNDPTMVVRIVSGFDDICNCGVCPNRKQACESAELTENDRRLAVKHGVSVGEWHASAELVELVMHAASRPQSSGQGRVEPDV